MKRPYIHLLLFASLCFTTFLLSSCSKEEENTPTYSIPDTYSFANVNYSGQTARLNLLSDMGDLLETGRTGTKIKKDDLLALWNNTQNLYAEGKRLSDKCYAPDKAVIERYFQDIERISGGTEPGAPGVAGVDGGRLFDENGIELEEMIEKTIMGSIFYYQATTLYLGEEMNVDNKEVTEGEGTAMEHHFDEAFGYFGAPVDFGTNKENLRFYAKYCHSVDGLLQTDAELFGAFLKGRAAISNKDMKGRDEAIASIRTTWEKVIAANTIHYINSSLTNIANRPSRNHTLTEALGFIRSLKYNIERKASDAQIAEWEAFIGTNLDQVQASNLQTLKNSISSMYGLDSVKDQL